MTQLIKVSSDKQDDWDLYIDPILFGYRSTVQASTKCTPFEVMFGVKPRLPIDLQGEGDAGVEECDPEVLAARLEDVATTCVETRERVKENICQAQERQKIRYDLKHHGPTYEVGQKVLKYDRRRDTRMGDKLGSRYTGPFVIHEALGKGVYRLRNGDAVMKTAINATNLKIYHDQTSPSSSPLSSPVKRTTTSPKKVRTADEVAHPAPTADPWLAQHNLMESDRSILTTGEWLNDKLIDAGNKLVGMAMGSANQTSLLAQTSFAPAPEDTAMVIHDQDHWVACGSFGGEVLLADSARRPVSPLVAKQLRELFQTQLGQDNKLRVKVVPCPTQTNGSDCGIYAIAFCTEWAYGQMTLDDIAFDVPKMREHMEQSLTDNMLTPFPKIPFQRKGRRRLTRFVDL